MKTNLKKIYLYALAYISWVFSWVIFVWFILLSRETFLAVLRNFWAPGSFTRQMSITFIDRAYVIFIGIIWVILMIVTESYFRNGIIKGNLYQRLGKVIGVELAAIFLVDLVMVLLQGYNSQPWTRLAILFFELVVSLALIWLGWFKYPNKLKTPRI